MQGADHLIAGIAHDMRTPVGVIAGIAQLMLEQHDAQAVRGQAERILSACAELTAMIDSALDLAAGATGQIALLNAPFSPEKMVRSVQDAAMELARSRGQALNVTLCGPCARRVVGDVGRLRRVLMNLLSNAVKYTPPGGRIELSACAREERERLALRFCVRDDGMGMDEATIARLFTPFSRAKEARSAGIEGTGLGMSIVHTLTQAMGGAIDVQSRPGEGSAFTLSLSLPLAADISVDFRGMRFLLAEDNAIAADVMAELLRERGARVTLALDGEQAVARFAESGVGAFDVVLMDMLMPRMDGCAAARAIRAMARPDARRVMIIALTGAATKEMERQALESGMNTRAMKPLRMDELAGILMGNKGKKDKNS